MVYAFSTMNWAGMAARWIVVVLAGSELYCIRPEVSTIGYSAFACWGIHRPQLGGSGACAVRASLMDEDQFCFRKTSQRGLGDLLGRIRLSIVAYQDDFGIADGQVIGLRI